MSRFPCAFDPMDSDTYENIGESEYEYDDPPVIEARSTLPTQYFEPQEDESDIPIATNDDHSITTTDIKNLKAVIQTKTCYSGDMQFSKYLKMYPGLIIMPLSCVSLLRKPNRDHKSNPQVLVYIPTEDESYPNFDEAINFLNSE